VALTQSQLVAAVADRAELSKAEAKRALDALDEIVLEELGNAQKVRLGGLVQLTVRVKPATQKRAGRNPATGEEITIGAKPASVDVRASAGEGEGGASVGAEGSAAAGGVERPRLSVAPTRRSAQARSSTTRHSWGGRPPSPRRRRTALEYVAGGRLSPQAGWLREQQRR